MFCQQRQQKPLTPAHGMAALGIQHRWKSIFASQSQLTRSIELRSPLQPRTIQPKLSEVNRRSLRPLSIAPFLNAKGALVVMRL